MLPTFCVPKYIWAYFCMLYCFIDLPIFSQVPSSFSSYREDLNSLIDVWSVDLRGQFKRELS